MPFDPTSLTATPAGAPLVPTLPIRMRRTEVLSIVYRTRPDAAAALVPEPLELQSDLCVLHVYAMHDADWFGVYGESALHIPVRLPGGRPAAYSPFLVLASDGAVATGRELYGQPKKSGSVSLGPVGDLLVGRVARNGIDVATATLCWKQEPAGADSLAAWVDGASDNVNLRVQHVDGERFRHELLLRSFTEVHEHEAWTGPSSLELRPNAQVPLHSLPVLEVVHGLHRVMDFTLPPAQVVHRYDGD